MIVFLFLSIFEVRFWYILLFIYFPIYLWETLRSPNWVGGFGRVWEIMGEFLGEYGRNPKFNIPKRHPMTLFGIKALIPPSQWMGDSGRVWEIIWELPSKNL